MATVLAFHLFFLLGNHYPRHILEVDANNPILLTLVNLLFSVFYSCFLYLEFTKNKTFFSPQIFEPNILPVYRRKGFRHIIFLMLLQMIFDGIFILLDGLSISSRFLSTDLLMLVQWLLIYTILSPRSFSSWQKKNLIGLGATILIIMSIGIIANFFLINDYENLLLRYETNAPLVIAQKNNATFFWELKASVLDTIIAFVLILFHSSETEQKGTEKAFAKTLLRCFVIYIVFSLAVVLKVNFVPEFSLVEQKGGTRESWHPSENGMPTYVQTYREFYRSNGKNEELECCYQSYERTLKYGSKELAVIHSNIPFSSEFHLVQKGEDASENQEDETFLVEGEEAYLVHNQAVCYQKKGVPTILFFHKLKDLPEDSRVTAVCIQLLSDGNVYVMEYATDYMLKYAPDFMEEYLDRIATGNFTDTESWWMKNSGYRSNFAIEFASEHL